MTADEILYAALAVGLMFAVLQWIKSPAPSTWIILGEAKFDVKNSWVTNTTIFGAILTTAVKDMKGFDVPPAMANLNVLFLALGLLAVVLNMANLRAQPNGKYGTQVWLFLIAAGVAVWAAAGQLLTLGYVVWKVPGTAMPHFATAVFMGAVVVAAVEVGVYAWNVAKTELAKAKPPKEFGVEAEGFTATTAPPERAVL